MVVYDGVEVRVWTQVFAALAATGGALAAGLCLGWTALNEDDLKEKAYKFKLNDDNFTWIGSLFTLGAATICIPIGFLITAIGRKSSMIVLIVPFTIGFALIIFAENVIMVYVGRYVLGIAGGAFCVTAPMYTGEIATKQIRGTLGTFFQLLIVTGILIAYILGATMSCIKGTTVAAIVPVVFTVILLFMPESPTYFVNKGKIDQAATSIQWLRGRQYDPAPEIALLQADKDAAARQSTSFFSALGRKTTLKSLFISLGLMFFQQMCGINAVIFYSGSIFKDAGTNEKTGTIIVGVVQLIVTFIATMVVDRLGRKLLLLCSGFIMLVCTVTLGFFFFMQNHDKHSVEDINGLPVVCLCVFIAAFSFGYGPIPWLMMGELFATDIKGPAGSLAGTFNWLLAFVVTKSFKSLTNLIGSAPTFWLFSSFSLVGIFFVWFCVPETKNKTLTQIQEELGETGLSGAQKT